MNNLEIEQTESLQAKGNSGQEGSALVIAVFVLVLISVFVAMALSRTSMEAAAVGNETAEGRTFYAAQASLEVMTRNFNKVFEVKLNPADADFDPVREGAVPRLDTQYVFDQRVRQTSVSKVQTLTGDNPFAGLYAQRDNWQIKTTATDRNTGVEVELTRNILNNRIPIFQFGIFYNDDLEFHPGPRFDFGGRVHSNGSMFLMAQDGLYFSSRVSAHGFLVTDVARNGKNWNDKWNDEVFIKDASGDNIQLEYNMGSALKNPTNGTSVFHQATGVNKDFYNPDMPNVYASANWAGGSNYAARFEGNLLSRQPKLDLPLKISSSTAGDGLDYIELVKRGISVGNLYNDGTGTPTAPVIVPVPAALADSQVTTSERYYNKPGIRISLADRKAKLPGCALGVGTAAVTAMCGVRLDGASTRPAVSAVWANEDIDPVTGIASRGYQPLTMADGYKATRLNGERFRTSAGEVWIKIELVSKDATTNAVVTSDVTEDILSLGVTEPAPCIWDKFVVLSPANYYSVCNSTTSTPYIDSRSIIKLQRFVMPGEDVNAGATNYMKYYSGWDAKYPGYNIVLKDECTNSAFTTGCSTTVNNGFTDSNAHKKQAVVNDSTKFRRIVPFPIEMFDTREGIYNTESTVLNTGTVYGSNVPWAGVMSMIDIDVKNFRRFLSGEFDTKMPTGTTYYESQIPNHVLRNHPTDPAQNDVPQNNGWVIYISDRRGDSDFDGEYDMEDIYGGNDGTLQPGENVNNSPTTSANGGLDTNYTNEAVRYTGTGSSVSPSQAASVDHSYYRRGVRLINGQVLPGKYDSATAANTRGFTVASENGVYVLGNYNADSIDSVGTPTASTAYNPQDTAEHIPASIVADAVTILSNNWNDSKSFRYPFDSASNKRKATETFIRFAMLTGDARSSFEAEPNQGGGDRRLGGGVHNFKRFLEHWGSVRLNYVGSIINLFNARNNNGSFKNSTVVYNPPTRNWVFDSTFLDPARLPPGTPYFQFVQTTGFQRTND